MTKIGTVLGVMTTQVSVNLASGHNAWDGTFTHAAARPDGQEFGRGHGTLHASWIMPPR